MACRVHVNQHGNLYFRLDSKGRGWQEATPWKDQPKSRIKAEAKAVLISDEMRAKTFDYPHWFPDGNRIDEFRPKQSVLKEPSKLTIRGYFEIWVLRKVVPLVRKGQARDYRQHFHCYILDFLGDRLRKQFASVGGSVADHRLEIAIRYGHDQRKMPRSQQFK